MKKFEKDKDKGFHPYNQGFRVKLFNGVGPTQVCSKIVECQDFRSTESGTTAVPRHSDDIQGTKVSSRLTCGHPVSSEVFPSVFETPLR